MSFVCPTNMAPHCRKVLEGEYDVPGLELPTGSVVLDIGANCGAFTVWALKRWPGCKVIAYEPNPEAIEYWKRNCQGLNAELHPVAVTTMPGPALLKFGKNNLGEASLYDLGEQQEAGIAVNTLHPENLPDASMVKIDAEGAELDIFRRMALPLDAIAFEFHRASDWRWIDGDLRDSGFELIRGQIASTHRGTLVYSR